MEYYQRNYREAVAYLDGLQILEKNWKRTYSKEQNEVIAHHAKGLSKKEFSDICKVLITNERFFPLPKTIIDACSAKRSSSATYKQEERVFKLECEYCCDTGYVFLDEPEAGIDIFARCFCEKGKSGKEGIMRLEKEHVPIIKEFPHEKFKPSENESEENKIDWWMDQLDISEQFFDYKKQQQETTP